MNITKPTMMAQARQAAKTEEYVHRAMPILHRRLVQAGIRLASLLNEALK